MLQILIVHKCSETSQETVSFQHLEYALNGYDMDTPMELKNWASKLISDNNFDYDILEYTVIVINMDTNIILKFGLEVYLRLRLI